MQFSKDTDKENVENLFCTEFTGPSLSEWELLHQLWRGWRRCLAWLALEARSSRRKPPCCPASRSCWGIRSWKRTQDKPTHLYTGQSYTSSASLFSSWQEKLPDFLMTIMFESPVRAQRICWEAAGWRSSRTPQLPPVSPQSDSQRWGSGRSASPPPPRSRLRPPPWHGGGGESRRGHQRAPDAGCRTTI